MPARGAQSKEIASHRLTDGAGKSLGGGSPDDVAIMTRVLDLEAAGLTDLADAVGNGLGEALTHTLDCLIGIPGRVVVTGIGKSGHVARKIAATLASTGTPALFVHPSEASHGDLGMISRGDAVLALSNSGGSAELADIVGHTRRHAIPLIAITANAESALAEQADATLTLPSATEACPMGLAPTTSTTMMLALGDALAIALLTRRGSSPDDFHRLHPGGTLGRRLIRVLDIMHVGEAMPLVSHETSMADAIVDMTARSFGCTGVVDAGQRLIGIVTDGDLRRHMAEDLLSQPVGKVMTEHPRTIRAGALAVEAVRLMNQMGITSLFIVDEDGRPVGFLHLHDCLRTGIG